MENRGLSVAGERFVLGRVLFDVRGLEDDPANEFDAQQGYLRGVVLSDGSLAAIDVHRVHFFDPQGRRNRIVGGAGRGPGEFQYLMEICRTDTDSIVVVDSRNRHASVLNRHGDFVRTTTVSSPGAYPIGCLGSDEVLLSETNTQGGGAASGTILHAMRLDGSRRRPIATIPGAPLDLLTQTETRAVATGGRIYGANPGEPDVRVWNAEGTLIRIIRTGDRVERFTASELERLLERASPINFPPAQRREFMQRLSLTSPRRTWPVFQTVHVSPSGRMWMQRYARGGGEDVLVRRRDADGALRLTRIEIVGSQRPQRTRHSPASIP